MSDGAASTPRRLVSTVLAPPLVKPWRLIVLGIVVVAITAAVVTPHVVGGSPQLSASGNRSGGANGSGSGASGNGGHGSTAGNGANGSNASGGSSTGGGNGSNGGSSSGGKSQGSASMTPVPTPGDTIIGTPDLLQSNCPRDYTPGITCQVYYQGRYYMTSHPVATLLITVTVDGSVATSATYTAPAGSKQYGSTMKFKVPDHMHTVVYQAFLKDPVTGAIIAKTQAVTNYGDG